jgi:hypothetical protein
MGCIRAIRLKQAKHLSKNGYFGSCGWPCRVGTPGVAIAELQYGASAPAGRAALADFWVVAFEQKLAD